MQTFVSFIITNVNFVAYHDLKTLFSFFISAQIQATNEVAAGIPITKL